MIKVAHDEEQRTSCAQKTKQIASKRVKKRKKMEEDEKMKDRLFVFVVNVSLVSLCDDTCRTKLVLFETKRTSRSKDNPEQKI